MDPNEQMLKPITELLTLACLNEDASSSYYISKLINERTEGAIHIPTAIIIPYLYHLLESGRIRETPKVINGRNRICYALTPTGEERLAELIDAYMSTHQAFLLFLNNQREALKEKKTQDSENT